MCPNFFMLSLLEHEPIDGRYSTFALAVHNIDSGIGVELTGNAVAVTTTRIVTAFHNIYDEIPSGSDMTESSEFLIKTMFSEESQCDVDIRIFNHAIITKVVFKQNKDDIEEMVSPILMKFVDGNYNEDWAVLEVVNGVTTYSGLNICSDLAPFQFLHICPVEDLPKPGMDYLKGYYFDLGLYKTSPDPEEALYCQKINHSQVITYKPRSCMYRMTGGLSRESSGCPYINSNGYLVAIHSASLDSSYSREPKTRFRMFTRSEKKRARLTTSNLKKFSGHSENHVDNIREEQERVYDDISSLGDSFTAFKEGFCLGKSTQFMSLLQNS